LLSDPRATHRVLYVNGGAEPIEEALALALA
jgi:acetylornithine/succinyldiaminopimelate/putrescine aminotransferase